MASNVVFCLLTILIPHIKHTIGLNNRMRSPIPPLNMSLNDIPMFLTITFDDALHGPAHEKTQLIMNHVNRNNEPIPLVYFISNEFSDYSLVQQRYLQGCEFAVHTVTHTTNSQTDITKWYHEIKTSRELLHTHADIPITEVVGFRAPYLQGSDLSFQVLNGLKPKFLYDSTIPSSLQNDLFDWPYTFDIYEQDLIYSVGQGPKQSYPGLWEVPMYSLYKDFPNKQKKNKKNKQAYDIMDYTTTNQANQANSTLMLQSFKDNFMHRMNTNKSPMGLYFHSSWLYTDANVQAMNEFIEWVLTFDNTWIVNNKDVINWINNPITAAQYSYINNNQLENGKTNFISCSFIEGVFKTVQDECPLIIPHNLRWDDTQLISSDITITSTNDNILTTVTDICINDTYAIYDANTVYCANPPIKELVKYNGAIYECAWWTTGETPGIDFAWVLIKQCLIYTDSFFKATITPYGTVKMFQDYVLDIDINLNPGYDLTRVSVAADNNIYHYYNFNNLSIFEDYDFIRNNQTNAAKLTIRFIEILYTTYTIEFSFKDVTIAPTQTPTISTINPSNSPTLSPTIPPSIAPSNAPSNIPTIAPSLTPSNAPTFSPTISPTISPSNAPSITPTLNPSITPTTPPTIAPSIAPSLNPTNVPTIPPSIAPSNAPTNPSQQPTKYPSYMPSQTPTISPTNPTVLPTKHPTKNPTIISESPTINPSHNPTKYPIIETTFESMESMDNKMNDYMMINGVVINDSGMIGILIAILFIFSVLITGCIGMYCKMRKQKQMLITKIELEDIKSHSDIISPKSQFDSLITSPKSQSVVSPQSAVTTTNYI